MQAEVISADALFFVIPSESDEDEFLARVKASGDLHQMWVSPPADPAGFAAYLARVRSPGQAGFLIRSPSELVGVVNINNIVMGALRSGHLGYYAFSGSDKKGFMTKGLDLVVRFAFAEMGLHRLEANIQPGNLASIGLVRKLGFVKEGFSERYLYLAGAWRDHERWALTCELVDTAHSAHLDNKVETD
jgi:ribosomal-protein-alanine N-acetyltransferase